MDSATRSRLLALNRSFYADQAADFSATRGRPWPGWQQVLDRFDESAAGPRLERSVLDLGCGNGRFASACAARSWPRWSYLGIDDSEQLLTIARQRLAVMDAVDWQLRAGDLLTPDAPAWPQETFDLVTLFGVLHHLPGSDLRSALLVRAARRVAPSGLLAVSFWQLGESARLTGRAVDPAAHGFAGDQLGSADFLLPWGSVEAGATSERLRYCHHCSPAEAERLVTATGLTPIASFRADGQGGKMNLYWLLTASG